MFWARLSKPRPLMRSWGESWSPRSHEEEKVGAGEEEERLNLEPQMCWFTHSTPTTLGSRTRPPAHVHSHTCMNSCRDHTRVCHSLSMFRLLKAYSLPDPLPLPTTHSHGGLDPWNTLRLEQGTCWHFCTLSNPPGLHPWVNKYFLNTHSSTNSLGALTVHQALF